jgi:hypothetical protein
MSTFIVVNLLSLHNNYFLGKTTISTTSKKVSKFLNLDSNPTKSTQSWNIIGGKKYGEAKLKEIDEYMLKNKLRYSQKDPGRYPPILEPIKDDNKSSSSSSTGVVGLPSIKNVLDKVVPVVGVSSSITTTTTTTNFDIEASATKTSNVGSVASVPIVDTPVAEKIIVKKKRSVLDLSGDDLKGKRYDDNEFILMMMMMIM